MPAPYPTREDSGRSIVDIYSAIIEEGGEDGRRIYVRAGIVSTEGRSYWQGGQLSSADPPDDHCEFLSAHDIGTGEDVAEDDIDADWEQAIRERGKREGEERV
jgi:hypothetical protein